MRDPVVTRGMRWLALALLPCVVVPIGSSVVADGDEGEDEQVEELMEETHEGDRSPFGTMQGVLEAGNVDWGLVEAAVPRFVAMAEALRRSENKDISGSADGYRDAVSRIQQASRVRDVKALREAFGGLKQSCGDCHYKDGVGGPLHEEEHDDDEGEEQGPA